MASIKTDLAGSARAHGLSQRIGGAFDHMEALYEKLLAQRQRKPSGKPPGRRRVETLIIVCWAIIIVKSFLSVWAVDRYHVPFSALWVIVPTLAGAFIVTALYYYWRE